MAFGSGGDGILQLEIAAEPKMTKKRKMEIFSAGCAICNEAIEAVKREACPSCDIVVHDMRDMQIVRRAKDFGIQSVPAVVIDGNLSSCCTARGIDIEALKSEGLGKGL
jgi:glutaredoxin